MTSLYPQPPSAKEPRYARSLLCLHAACDGFFVGSLGGIVTATVAHVFPTSLIPSRFRLPSTAIPTPPIKFPVRLLSHAGLGGLLGLGILELSALLTMGGRTDIDSQYRARRLRGNQSQLESDWWILGGGTICAAITLAAVRRGWGGGLAMSQWRAMGGGASVGSVISLIAYQRINKTTLQERAKVLKAEWQY